MFCSDSNKQDATNFTNLSSTRVIKMSTQLKFNSIYLNFFFICTTPHESFSSNIINQNMTYLISLGNSFIVNIGLSDLIVSLVVIPISIVSLLATNKNMDEPSLSVCKFQWFLATCTFLISILTLAVSRHGTSVKKFIAPPAQLDVILSPTTVPLTNFS